MFPTQLLSQVEIIAKLSHGAMSRDEQGNEQLTGTLLRSRLEEHWGARSAFGHVLDGAKTLAMLCSDMIGVDGGRLA